MNVTGPLGAALFGIAIAQGVFFVIVGSKEFMSDVVIRQDGSEIIFSRSIHPPQTIADYTVILVPKGDDAPICEGHGWAEYTPDESKTKRMSIDLFVGDHGCEKRLAPGVYVGRAYWVPRDRRHAKAAEFLFDVK